MGIPEHNKCVAIHKRMRYNKQNGNWRKVRSIRRKNGEIKLKMRIRQMMRVEFEIHKLQVKKKYGMEYSKFMKTMCGKQYRKWGKYGD